MAEASMSLTTPLKQGWDWMVRMLFQPFDLGKWLTVGFAAWLAGLADGGNGSSLNWDTDEGMVHVFDGAREGWEWLMAHGIVAGLLVAAVLVILALIVLVLWLSSRGKFIFLDNVIHNRGAIIEPWKRLRRLGNSLFAFRLIVIFLCFPVALSLIGICVWLTAGPGGWAHLEGVSLLIGAVITAILGSAVLFVTLYAVFFLDAYVVPLMYRFDLGVMDGWRRFFELFRLRPWWFLLSGLFVFGLFVLAFSVIVATGFLTCCLGFLLLAIPYVGTVFLLPLIITYRAFTVAFLAQVEPEINLTV